MWVRLPPGVLGEKMENSVITTNEYKRRIRNYLQSPQSTDVAWDYVLDSLLDVAATMGLDLLDEQILSKEELKNR